MRSLSKPQWILILVVIGLGIVLWNLDIKAPNSNKEVANNEESKASTTSSIDLQTLKTDALKNVPTEVKNNISTLEKKLEKSTAEEQKGLRLELAELYFAYKQFALAASYFLEASEKEATNADLYVKAGNAFRDAYRNSNDSNLTPLLVEKAKYSFTKALEIAPENLDAKTGMATCYVEASENPMQGIQLLREVVQVDPENVNANLNLGLFSMKSGQYDKAVSRFETVVKKSPSAENYAMLAESYEQSGDKENAIKALKKAKEYIIDPQILQGVDDYIKKLEK